MVSLLVFKQIEFIADWAIDVKPMSIKPFLILTSFLIFVQAGCSTVSPNYSNARDVPGGGSTSTQAAELANTQTKVPSATVSVKADLVITPEMNGQKFTVLADQTIFVSLPIDFQKSIVEFDKNIITAIPADLPLAQPGPASWLFRAIQPGTTELRIVMDVAPLPKYEFVVYLTVQPRP
jgi:hypothetical protein